LSRPFSPRPRPRQERITAPEAFFGHRLGADRQIARWDKIVEYFALLQKESPRLKVENMGPSTEGHPFLAVFISSPENLANLDRLREMNARLSDPRGVAEAEIERLIAEGKAVICQSMSLHATEIGGTQMAPELAYDLASRNDEETRRILDNVIYIMIPSFNPDGQIMVTDWYRKWVGTEYEAAGLPWLYHKYAGHDNNRDGDFINLVESEYAAKLMYRDWPPQAYIDHHHMGSYGARLYVPPYCDPIRPYADPLIWRELSWYGAHIAYKLEEAGKTGILNDAQYPGWGHFGWHWITPFHNIAGMLTESASAKLATPLFIHREQLQAGARQFPAYEAQSSFPHPWEGGWWRLRDVVEQQKISAWALLDMAARNRETVLRNAYLKAQRQTDRGAAGSPAAYVVSAVQHDPLTAVKMIDTLLKSGLEIRRSDQAFGAGAVVYPAGSFVIPLAQPKMGLVRNLLGRTVYPDNAWTRAADGTPLRPYDTATHTMNEIMGVQTDPVEAVPAIETAALRRPAFEPGTVEPGGAAYALDGRLNDAFRAANLLLAEGVAVHRVDDEGAGAGLKPGDFVASGGAADVLAIVAAKTGVPFRALAAAPARGTHALHRARVGLYQRYMGGNMDEGWTRLVLEKFDFPYTSLHDADIVKGGLEKSFDAIILPADSTLAMTGDVPAEYRSRMGAVPPDYRSGFGAAGVKALQEFVRNGGTLVTLGEASAFAIEKLGLAVREVTGNIPSKEFFCPGSTLRATFDTTHPLAYGMPEKGLALFFSSPAFEIVPGDRNEDYATVVRYADRDLLESGWLIGEEHLAGRSAMISAAYGRGRAVLIGLRAQNRAQTHGTFKLLFNALLN
jgi:hypothetical protein